MRNIPIKNEELIELLESIVPTFHNIDFDQVNLCGGMGEVERWCGEKYREQIIYRSTAHDGFPEKLLGVDISSKGFSTNNQELWQSTTSSFESFVESLQSWASARNNALAAVYPPGGYISWHTNANAPGYNVLFTWSETGDGYFEHIDPATKEHVVTPDVKGWQCKFGYYGSYDEPDKVLYHAARTNCLRSTVAFVFNGDESGKQMAEMLIEEISES